MLNVFRSIFIRTQHMTFIRQKHSKGTSDEIAKVINATTKPSDDENNTEETQIGNKKKIDYSKVPVLHDEDLEEQMVKGSGPGGQAVNKTSNCIVLRHKPTNIVVKCHIHRAATANRKEARKKLIERLDEKFNGKNSVANQLKALQQRKTAKVSAKRKKLEEMKSKWKERENLE